MRPALVILAFLPFLYYALRDARFHFVGRRVSFAEHMLHLGIGIALVIVLTHAVLGNSGIMLAGLVLLTVCGAVDEFLWHRSIPEVESDLHAKEHLALLIFVVATLVVNWLETHGWRLDFHQLTDTDWTGLQSAATSGDVLTGRAQRNWWSAAVLPCALLPYVALGLSDNLHHARQRSVPWTERILHATIVLAMMAVVPNAFTGNHPVMLAGLVLFVVARALDEWGFHCGLPGREIDLHAKTHFSVLVFIVTVMLLDWFEAAGTRAS